MNILDFEIKKLRDKADKYDAIAKECFLDEWSNEEVTDPVAIKRIDSLKLTIRHSAEIRESISKELHRITNHWIYKLLQF